jgi:polar amino acid transport system substrate-binding protein
MLKHKLLIAIALLATTVGIGPLISKAETVYRIGVDPTNRPFEYYDDEKKITGFEPELIAAAAKAAKFKYELLADDFSLIMRRVQTDDYDAGISSLFITPKRELSYDFSDSYFKAGISLAAEINNTKIQKLSDFKGKSIGAENESSASTYLRGNYKKLGVIPKLFISQEEMMRAFNDGEIAGILNDTGELYFDMKRDGNIKIVKRDIKMYDIGLITKKNSDSDFLVKFNEGLQQVKDSGKLEQLVTKYFGDDGKIDEKDTDFIKPENASSTLRSVDKKIPETSEPASSALSGVVRAEIFVIVLLVISGGCGLAYLSIAKKEKVEVKK